jgi:hypothetical protein
MLAEHPTIASPPETHLFANYLGPLATTWTNDKQLLDAAIRQPRTQVGHGLATTVTDEEFRLLLRSLYSSVRDLVLAEKPGAQRLLEKTPDHARWLEIIMQIVPDAAVVFMVRDPRESVRSLLQASCEQWGGWAPSSLKDATSLWLTNVRPYFANKRDPRVLLVRYEDLRGDSEELERIAKFLGLERPSEWLQTPVDASPQDRSSTIVRGDAADGLQPYATAGFSYHDRQRSRVLSDYESAYIVERCRNEMNALGYDTSREALPLRLRAEHLLQAVQYWTRTLRSHVRRKETTSG